MKWRPPLRDPAALKERALGVTLVSQKPGEIRSAKLQYLCQLRVRKDSTRIALNTDLTDLYPVPAGDAAPGICRPPGCQEASERATGALVGSIRRGSGH
jgi:hypothetical protein